MYPNAYICVALLMPSFKKKNHTTPVIGNHHNDVSKDWYVFFRFKHEGKVFKFKRREGINRIKKLRERLVAIRELRSELEFDLEHGWNPILDKKREYEYNSYLYGRGSKSQINSRILKLKKVTKQELFNKYYYKGRT
jgi:hypothetical protein